LLSTLAVADVLAVFKSAKPAKTKLVIALFIVVVFVTISVLVVSGKAKASVNVVQLATV
jgi:hypothetical protein